MVLEGTILNLDWALVDPMKVNRQQKIKSFLD
jgi:hypothetical protein